MDLSLLKQEVVEEGKGHPFVEALVGTLKRRQLDFSAQLEVAASGNANEGTVGALAGRARESREIIRLITETRGAPE